MSYLSNKAQYMCIIHRFLESRIDGVDFTAQFCALWKRDRDDAYAKKHCWSEPLDQQLMTGLASGEITKSEFSKRWSELWEYEEDISFVEMTDKIFSACDVFVADSQMRDIPTSSELEYDENHLRAFVAQVLADNKGNEQKNTE